MTTSNAFDTLRSGLENIHVQYAADQRLQRTEHQPTIAPEHSAPTLRVRIGKALVSLGTAIAGISL